MRMRNVKSVPHGIAIRPTEQMSKNYATHCFVLNLKGNYMFHHIVPT